MVSVRRFIQDEPAIFYATQQFVDFFANQPDPIIEFTSKLKTPESRIAWSLLGTDLFQSCDYNVIAKILNSLYEAFPEQGLWTLPVPSGKDIDAVIKEALDGYDWPLLEHAPGIFWSIGLFVRRHENLLEWLESRTPEEIWRDLGEIYFMGKHNPRPKVCAALYRLNAISPMGLGIAIGCKSTKLVRWPDLPLTMGSRRFLAMLGPAMDEDFANMDSSEKQKLQNEYCSALSPENPYKASHALQFFLERGEEDFICRKKTAQCTECPIFEFCNYAIQRK